MWEMAATPSQEAGLLDVGSSPAAGTITKTLHTMEDYNIINDFTEAFRDMRNANLEDIAAGILGGLSIIATFGIIAIFG